MCKILGSTDEWVRFLVDSSADIFGTQIEVFSFSGKKTIGMEDKRLCHGLEAIIHPTHYCNFIRVAQTAEL